MTDPVLIVGAGPTGLTAALELSRLGIAVRLVDKATAPATTSRAIGVQARTLELLDQRGLAAEMVRLGNPAHGGNIYGDGKHLFRLDFGHVDSRYQYVLLISQAETERILRDAIARHGVTIERGVELVGVAQDPLSHDASPVTATLRHADGRLELARTPWLISAEGAHSISRTTLDLRFEGKTLDEAYALGDLHVDSDLSNNDLYVFSSEHGFLVMFPMGGGRFRLIASNPFSTPSKDTEPSLDELQRLYDQRSHIPARFHDMAWGSWFHINSRMVPRLRVGRLLLGGDAAHIHSPAGAQGMNTGIQDMINLGWKLARVIQGRAPDALLETYEQDRLPIMRDVLFKTENLTEVIGTENHVVRAIFNHLGPFVGGSEIIQRNATARMSQVSLGYRGSPLSAGTPHGGKLEAGDRVPDMPVRYRGASSWGDARLHSLLDPSKFVLLAAHGAETDAADPALEGAASALGNDVAVVRLAPPQADADQVRYRTAFGSSGVFLARPDGYVGLASGAHLAASALADYGKRWFTSEGTRQAG